MKKILTLLAFLSICYLQSSAQLVQAGIGGGAINGCSKNQFKIFLKSNITLTEAIPANKIGTLQFAVRIKANLLPAPTLSIKTSNILDVNQWIVSTGVVGNDGFRYYTILNAQGGYPSPLIANKEFEVMKLELQNGPALATNVHLVTLGDGGDINQQVVNGNAAGNILFLYTSLNANSNSNPNKLYYHRLNTVELNHDSYNSPDVNPTTESWAKIFNIIITLPLTSKATGGGQQVSVYPNPAITEAKVTLELAKSGPVNIILTSTDGKIVDNQKFTGVKGFNARTVNFSKLTNGNYTFKIITDEGTDIIPVVKTSH